jgi:peroxiredoxin
MFPLLAPFLLSLVSPTPLVVSVAPQAVLSGQFTHAPAGDTLRVFYGKRIAKTVLRADGTFRLVVPALQASTYGRFSYAKQQSSLFLSPGDQLRISLDYPHLDETLQYTGRGAAPNNYLAQWLWRFIYGPGNARSPYRQFQAAATPLDLQQRADAFRQEQQTFLMAYAQTHPLPPAFRRDAALHIDLDWALSQLTYASYYRASQGATTHPLPATYFDFLHQLPLRTLHTYPSREPNQEIEGLLQSFYTAYRNRLVPTGIMSADPAEAERLYAQATADFGLSKGRDRAMVTFYSLALSEGRDDVVFASYSTFRRLNQDSLSGRQLHRAMQQLARLQPGQPAPAFTLRNQQGQVVSLADFRGKVVYLDFWGTWCGPCMEEMTEFSPAIKAHFAQQDVVFVNISVGDPEDTWQRTLVEKHFLSERSVHLRHPTEAPVTAAYLVDSYPTYFLIGRDGRIITRQAPRPSSGDKLVAALEQALAATTSSAPSSK